MNIKQAIDEYLTTNLVQYTTPIVFGNPANKIPLNGSISLLELNNRKIGITCDHVISTYLKMKSVDNNIAMQINRTKIEDINSILISSSEKYDIAVIDLKNIETSQIVQGVNIGTTFFKLKWPPPEINKSDRICLLGFPGRIKIEKEGKIYLPVCTIGAQFVSDYSETTILSIFDRKYWTFTPKDTEYKIPQDLGGLSGGPVFAVHNLENIGLLYYDFVGIVKQQASTLFDGILISKINMINLNGTING
jgi:hypothetical protein